MIRRLAFRALTAALRGLLVATDRALALHRWLANRWGIPVRWR